MISKIDVCRFDSYFIDVLTAFVISYTKKNLKKLTYDISAAVLTKIHPYKLKILTKTHPITDNV